MTPAEIDALLVEPMARAMCIANKRDPDGPRWINANTQERWGICWHENIDAARAALAAQLATLDTNGLFIGPEVATEGMRSGQRWVSPESVGMIWADAVAAWQRGDGT